MKHTRTRGGYPMNNLNKYRDEPCLVVLDSGHTDRGIANTEPPVRVRRKVVAPCWSVASTPCTGCIFDALERSDQRGCATAKSFPGCDLGACGPLALGSAYTRVWVKENEEDKGDEPSL